MIEYFGKNLQVLKYFLIEIITLQSFRLITLLFLLYEVKAVSLQLQMMQFTQTTHE